MILTPDEEKELSQFNPSPLNNVFQSIQGVTPIEAAKVLKYSRVYGVSPEQAAFNQKQYDNTVSEPDFASLSERSPKTAAWLYDPMAMAVTRTQENIRKLEDIEGGWKVWRALKEGGKGVASSFLGSLKGYYETQVNTPRTVISDTGEAYSYTPPEKEIRATGIDKMLNSSMLKARPVVADTALGQYGYDFLQTVPQIAAQWAAFALTGGVGSMAFMGSQIAGDQYLKLQKDNVDAKTAFTAALTNAAMQAPMEQLSLGRIFKKIPANSTAAFKAKEIVQRSLTEGLTEWAQQYPDAATELWAKNPGKTIPELASMYADDLANITKEGMYQGLVAAPFGFLGGAIATRTKEQVTRSFVANIEKTAIQLQKSELLGLSPEAAEAHLNAVTDNKPVFIEPESLLVMYQQGDVATKEAIEKHLDLTEEQMMQAVQTGELLEVPASKFIVMEAQNPEIGKALHEHIAESEEGHTLSKAVERKNQEDVRQSAENIKKQNDELRVETDNLMAQIDAAAPNASVRDAARATVSALVSHARVMSENPAQWLRDNGPKYVRGEMKQAGAMGQENRTFMQNKTAGGGGMNTVIISKEEKSGFSGRYEVQTVSLDNKEKLTFQQSTNSIIPGDFFRLANDKGFIAFDKEGNIIEMRSMEADNRSYYAELGQNVASLLKENNFTGTPETAYMRFGRIPKDGKSKNHATGNKEKGTSVYEIEKNPLTGTWVLTNNGTDPLGLISLIQSGKTPHLVSGDSAGYGSDGEPVLTNAKQIRRLFYDKDKNGFSEKNKKQETTADEDGGSLFQAYKGSIHWQDGRAIISLFETADPSTLVHETVGHYFLESLMTEGAKPDAPEWMQKDRQTTLDHLGIESWENATPEQKIEAHEKMARSAEAYFMTGEAPSLATRSMFRRFKDWLLKIYNDVSDLNVNITPEIKGVFDRMLATQDEIAQVESIDKYHARLPDAVLKALPAHVIDRLDKQIVKARQMAEDILQGKLMKSLTAERKQEVEQERRRATESIRESVQNDPVYSALKNLNIPLTEDETFLSNLLNAKQGSPSNLVDSLKNDKLTMIEELARYLQKEHSDGVEQVKIFDQDGHREAGFRVSHNAKWYRDYYAEHGKAPTLADLRYLAETFLRKGYQDYAEFVEPDKKFLATEEALKAAENLRDKTKANEWGNGQVDTDAVRAQFTGKEAVTTSLKDYLSENEVTMDMISDAYGYTSGDELAKKISELLPAEKEIQSQVDTYIKDLFPDDYLNPAAMKEAARESMYNDDGAMLTAIEQQVLEEKLTGALKAEESRKAAQQTRELHKAQARKIFENKTIDDAMMLSKYIASERRAAEKAAEYLGKGDIARAAEQKRVQGLAHAMVQESLNTRREFERINKYLNRQKKADRKTWVTEEHWQQAADIMARFGYQRRDYKGQQAESLAAYVNRMTEENPDIIAVADWLSNNRNAKPTKKLTLAELKDVEGAVRNIKQMAKFGANGDSFFVLSPDGLAETAGNLVNDAEENAKDAQIDQMGKPPDVSAWGQFWAGLRKPSQLFLKLDGFKDFGRWADVLYYKMADANNQKSELLNRVVTKLEEAFKSEGITPAQRYDDAHKKIYIQEWNTSVTKNTLRAILLNMGSDSNLKRMLSTEPVGYRSQEPWDQQNITNVLEKYLTASDFRLTQKIWDAINLYDEYNTMVKKVTGFSMTKVDPQPITFNVNGETIYLSGGYYPLKQDTRASKQAELNAEKALAGGGAGMMPYPNTGASKSRVSGAHYAVDYDFGNLIGSLNSTIHDIAFRPVAVDVNKLMRQDQIKEVLRRKLGDSYYQAITKWQNTVLKGKNSDVEGYDFIDKLARMGRQKAVVANLLFRVSTVFQNVANFTLYGNSVEGFSNMDAYGSFLKYGVFDYIPKALSGSAEAQATRDFIYSKSALMRDKMNDPDYTLRELHDSQNRYLADKTDGSSVVKAYDITQDRVTKFGSNILAFSDQLTDIPMWQGAYYKALADGKTDAQAVRLADTVIERSTGSGRTIDTAAMQRSGPAAKLLTMFMTFLNTQYNRWATESGIFMKDKDVLRVLSFVASQYLMFGILSAIGSFKLPKDDEDPLKFFAKEVLAWPMSMIPVGGSGAKYVLDGYLGFKTFGYAISPVERNIQDFLKLAGDVGKVAQGKKEMGDLAEPTMATMAFLFGYPDQFNDWFWNAHDIMNGMKPTPEDLVRRRPKKERN